MVKAIWERKGMPDTIDEDVTRYFAQEFFTGAESGYGSTIAGLDYDTPDYNMLASIQKDCYHFAGAKNYQQLKALSQALVGDDNKLRTWSQFKEAAYAINDQHVKQWLETEYHTAVASAQMAGKWVDIQSSKSALPLLQFDAIIDQRTSDQCRSLDGVIKRIDDAFWNTYYPPNHFRCRSTVKQLSSGPETPDEKIVHPDNLPAMFKTNLAKNGLAFPPSHPYYINLPAEVKEQAEKLLNKDNKKEN